MKISGSKKQRFYIASAFKNKNLVNSISNGLINQGYIQTYDWTNNTKASSLQELRNIAKLEFEGVQEADFLIFIFPGGKGANIEFGIASGLKKRIYILDLENSIQNFDITSTFYFLLNVHHFSGNVEKFVEFVIEKETT